jgi:DNA-binding GntR family transcriptional regulator
MFMVNNFKIEQESFTPYAVSAYKTIRRMITAGMLKPGERLVENRLSKQLGVSRTPIRESIRKLASEGLVYIRSKGGAIVSEFTKKDLDEIYEIRVALEGLAARKAALEITETEILRLKELLTLAEKACLNRDIQQMAKLTAKLDGIVSKASRNNRLFRLIDMVYTAGNLQRELILRNPGACEESVRRHKEILDALIRRDSAAAKQAVQNYIMRGKEIILAAEKASIR